MAIQKYSIATLLMATGRLDLRDSSIKLALLTADYTPDLDAHITFSDVEAYELDEHGEYNSTGEVIPGLTVSRTGDVVKWDGGDVTFFSITGQIKYGIIFLNKVTGSGEDEINQPLIALVDFEDSSPSTFISISGTDYTVYWNVDGIMDFGPCSEVCV